MKLNRKPPCRRHRAAPNRRPAPSSAHGRSFAAGVGAVVLAATLAGALSACAPLILGGAAVGAMMAVDRRTSGAQLEDEGIELRAASRLRDAVPAATSTSTATTARSC